MEFCEVVQTDPHQKVLQVARLSPPKKGGKDGWGMMTLGEVWNGVDLKTGRPIVVFVKKDGEREAINGVKTDTEIGLVEQVYP